MEIPSSLSTIPGIPMLTHFIFSASVSDRSLISFLQLSAIVFKKAVGPSLVSVVRLMRAVPLQTIVPFISQMAIPVVFDSIFIEITKP